MERDHSDKSAAALGTRPNGRFTAPFAINTPSRRKKLFGPGGADENAPLGQFDAPNQNGAPFARTSSSSSSDARATPNQSSITKIPRPTAQVGSAQRRSPFSLTDAFKVAKREEEEAAILASPSPAPRSWRTRRDTSEWDHPNPRSQGSPNPRPDARQPIQPSGDDVNSSIERLNTSSRGNDVSKKDSDDDQRRRIFQETPGGKQVKRSGTTLTTNAGHALFSKTNLGPKITKTGKELVRKASNNSLGTLSPPRPVRASPHRLSRDGMVRSREGNAQTTPSEHPEQDTVATSTEERRATVDKAIVPPATDHSPNGSFAWQADADFTAGDLQISTSPPVRLGRSNTKLDEIRALEVEATRRFPEEPAIKDGKADFPLDNSIDSAGHLVNRQFTRTNTKLDEIRSREIESLSRRALATARLDEIRERNAEPRSQSSSPEVSRVPSHELLRDSLPSVSSSLKQTPRETVRDVEDNMPPTEDSHDLLRRLARATSSSPAPTRAEQTTDHISGDVIQVKKPETVKSDVKPTVGFAGLQREPSVESNLSSRSRLAHSDSDPTDRIEGEKNLFAPREDYSEKGSLRAPSPEPTEELKEANALEETPKPRPHDPVSQPTPQVTGAYIDTPLTVKVSGSLLAVDVPEVKEPEQDRSSLVLEPTMLKLVRDSNNQVPTILKVPATSSLVRGRRTSHVPRNTKHTLSANGERALGSTSSTMIHRRAASLPRTRSPLINSVKPPTVRDDLLAIHRDNQLEDSTLDDFEDLLEPQESISLEIKDEDVSKDSLLKELETYDRMNKSLKTGLLGIRTAKQGIERLEDKVWHVDTRPLPRLDPADARASISPSLEESSDGIITFIRIPVPRLWHRNPSLRLTLVGLFTLLFSIWYVAESIMCIFYCKPDSCYSGQPCQWSHDDPSWGYSIPVKLDQWSTGGRGRELIPDILDWLVDIQDMAMGTDLLAADTSGYSWTQKQQHRRRLIKKGLVKQFTEQPEDKAKYEAWRAVRLEQEKVESAREMGYDLEDESMAADEKVRR